MDELQNRPLSVTAYPVAWRVEVVNDDRHCSSEYVRLEQVITQCVGAVY
jgi:hypothetical protein